MYCRKCNKLISLSKSGGDLCTDCYNEFRRLAPIGFNVLSSCVCCKRRSFCIENIIKVHGKTKVQLLCKSCFDVKVSDLASNIR